MFALGQDAKLHHNCNLNCNSHLIAVSPTLQRVDNCDFLKLQDFTLEPHTNANHTAGQTGPAVTADPQQEASQRHGESQDPPLINDRRQNGPRPGQRGYQGPGLAAPRVAVATQGTPPYDGEDDPHLSQACPHPFQGNAPSLSHCPIHQSLEKNVPQWSIGIPRPRENFNLPSPLGTPLPKEKGWQIGPTGPPPPL